MDQRQRILFIDAYDSFSNNLISLLESELNVSVTKISIHTALDPRWLTSFSAVMIGPGPGNPYEKNDTGCVKDIWHLQDDAVLPVLGICLGFQSLVVNFGGQVKQLPIPRHGIATQVTTNGTSIFRGIAEVEVVQYHSLYGVIDSGDECVSKTTWTPSSRSPDLVPLAWDVDHEFSLQSHHPEDGRTDAERLNPRKILMGVAHATKPFYGVQFHPESICSNPEARKVVVNWWNTAKDWNKKHGRSPECSLDYLAPQALAIAHKLSPRMPSTTLRQPRQSLQYVSERLELGSLNIPKVCELLRLHQNQNEESVILDSEMKRTADLSKHSIVGLVLKDTLKISYSASSNEVSVHYGDKTITESLQPYQRNIFQYLKAFMSRYQMLSTSQGTPFLGGLMGFISYEACLETIQVPPKPVEGRPDVMFAFVERSIVINHDSDHVLVQSIRDDDDNWVKDTAALLGAKTHSPQQTQSNGIPGIPRPNGTVANGTSVNGISVNGASVSGTGVKGGNVNGTAVNGTSGTPNGTAKIPVIQPPEEARYCQKIRECHSQIRQGNSYELCLTDQTRIRCQLPPEPTWTRYQRLRQLNPATFGAYIRLGPLSLLSSSPERFMSWSRPNSSSTSVCQFRPIKGTVKKIISHPDGQQEHVSLDTATSILSTPKERAENLMIVDLIRHDLASVVGSGNVYVRSLMQVEEYEHVYQLVTVIEGVLKPVTPQKAVSSVEDHALGIDVLAASLPPGSMTGAPKKRSCELLRSIEGEHQSRSVYSGVIGYMDVGGGGDFSVVIRTAYRWDDETNDNEEIWRIGAGGAITDMSTELGEWEEMYAKLDCALGLFK